MASPGPAVAQSIPPRTPVPPDWVHPDLQRLRAQHVPPWSAMEEQLRDVEEQHHALRRHEKRFSDTVCSKRAELESLAAQQRAAIRELRDAEEGARKARRLENRVSVQIIYHKTVAAGNPPELALWRDVLSFYAPRIASAHGSSSTPKVRVGVPPGDALELSATASTGALRPVCRGRRHSIVAAADEIAAAGTRGLAEGDPGLSRAGPTREYREQSIARFVQVFCPLFTVSPDTQQVSLVELFDEPCALDRANQPCVNASCVYYHQDQLHHVKIPMFFLYDRLKAVTGYTGTPGEWVSSRPGALCAVQRLLHLLGDLLVSKARENDKEGSALDCLAQYMDIVSTIIECNWHYSALTTHLLPATATVPTGCPVNLRWDTPFHEGPRPVQPLVLQLQHCSRTKGGRRAVAFLLRQCFGAEAAAGPVTAGTATAAVVASEWDMVAQLQKGLPPTPALLRSCATYFATDHAGESTWRLLFAIAYTHTVSVPCAAAHRHEPSRSFAVSRVVTSPPVPPLLWLSERGIQLFPCSPQVRVAHICLLLRCESSTTAAVVKACEDAVAVLSAQGGALVLAPAISPRMQRIAQCVGLLLAVVAVWLAERDTRLAEQFLIRCVEQPGRYFVLPVAQQNLSMLLLALRLTGRLHTDDLPLASISCTPFVLPWTGSRRLSDAGHQALKGVQELLAVWEASGLPGAVLSLLNGAYYVSVFRAVCSNASLCSQLLEGLMPDPIAGNATVWREYLTSIRHTHGSVAVHRLASALLAKCVADPTSAPPYLVYVLAGYLQDHPAWDSQLAGDVHRYLHRYAERHVLGATFTDENQSMVIERLVALAREPDLPGALTAPQQWVPLLVLLAASLSPCEALNLLRSIPAGILKESVDMAIVVLLEMIALNLAMTEGEHLGGGKGIPDTAPWSQLRRCTHDCLALLREESLTWLSPCEIAMTGALTVAHCVSLAVYRELPRLTYVGVSIARALLLEVSDELGVLHPKLVRAKPEHRD